MKTTETKVPTVFLGGTCAGSVWRDRLIPLLTIGYFNPVVDEWNEAAQALEIEKRETSDYVLYVLTPRMEGFFAVAEVVDDSNKRPAKTILCVLESEEEGRFTDHQRESLAATAFMVERNGARAAASLEEVASILNADG